MSTHDTGSRKKSRRHGGRRPGAGRPRGSGRYGEPTVPLRVPESLVVSIRELLDRRLARRQAAGRTRPAAVPDGWTLLRPAADWEPLPLPLFESRVAAGFPSPADDHLERTLDLNELLVRRPAATFFVRVEGTSMIGAGIHPGDILVVDRAEEAQDGQIVVAAVDGELTVKRLRRERARVYLQPENPDYRPIEITGDTDLVIWGVVTSVIHRL